MPLKPNTASETLGELAKGLRQLKALAGDLGLGLSLWDADGKAVREPAPANELCSLLCDVGGDCRRAAARLAAQVILDGQPTLARGECGCCLMGAPVHRRRRLLGAAVACFPPREMLEEEHLCRLCDRLHLDRQVVEQCGRGAVRHGEGTAEGLLRVLDRTLKSELAQGAAADELAMLSTNLATTYEELSLLYRISGAMRVTQRPEDFLQTVCDELLDVMSIETAAGVLYAYPPAVEADLAVSAGEIELTAEQIHLLADEAIGDEASGSHRAAVNNHVRISQRQLGAEVANMVVVPLAAEDERIGLLLGINKSGGEFDSVDLKLINAIGSQTGVFLSNNRLYADLQSLLMGVLHALTATIDAKDPYTCGHSRRVALVSRRLAEKTGFPPQRVQSIYLAGLLHDIGKIGVPEAILCKQGRLTEDEYDTMKRHPAQGARILGGIRQLDDVIVGIVTHHERLDGRGYPNGLSGKDVPIEGRIIGLADTFDAMTSDRTYRKALPLEAVTAEIRKCAGTQFDPMLVEKFLAMDLEGFLCEINQPVQTVFPLSGALEGGKE